MGGAPVASDGSSALFSRLTNAIKGNTTMETHLQKPVASNPSGTGGSTSSDIFLRMALDMLSNSREIRKHENLKIAIKAAFTAMEQKDTSGANESVILKPLQIACKTGNADLATIAVDCFGKLFSYHYWSFVSGNQLSTASTSVVISRKSTDTEEEDQDSGGTMKNIEAAIDAICECFTGETTDDKVQLQILKALQAALSNNDARFTLHGASLIKSIRAVYNIFLLGKSANVQLVAQGTVTQMVMTVMARAISDVRTKGTRDKSVESTPRNALVNQQYLIDALKVFRTLCMLSTKPIQIVEGAAMDLRSQPIRAKLLSLNLLHDILKDFPELFSMKLSISSETTANSVDHATENLFIDLVKEFLVLSISRNATSPVPPVFEVTYQLFSQILCHLRHLLKTEIGVFTCEIILPILERDTISWYQQFFILKAIEKTFRESQSDIGKLWVEIFLNYDCDPEAKAKENVWERFVVSIAKLLKQPLRQERTTPISANHIDASALGFFYTDNHASGTPALTCTNLTILTKDVVRDLYSPTGDSLELKRMGIRLMAFGILQPLFKLCKAAVATNLQIRLPPDSNTDSNNEPDIDQAPAKQTDSFESHRQRKQIAAEVIKAFNVKAKKGLQRLKDSNLLKNPGDLKEIAEFLFRADNVNKTTLGDFLGEGNEENIMIMHHFVDLMDFSDLRFVEALRQFLQHFRLPGEAQKIDRFMLKFAERYLKGNPSSFSSADVAYVLAYSTIMLNTDQHNPQVKKRMTKSDFIRNNRGINDGKDLPEQVLGDIFDEISHNEIVMKDVEDKKNGPEDKVSAPNNNVLAPSADLLFFKLAKKDGGLENLKTSEDMALKTEAMLTSLIRNNTLKSKAAFASSNRTSLDSDPNPPQYHLAESHEHVKHMIGSCWMPLLSALTTSLQDFYDIGSIDAALDAIKSAVLITCSFDMDSEKKEILAALIKLAYPECTSDLTMKRLKTLGMLLDIALQEGNKIDGENWIDIISCLVKYEKIEIARSSDESSLSSHSEHREKMSVIIDKLFTNSPKLTGSSIVHFVHALSKTSWHEISSSETPEQTRLYCLQRLVEISYYNMNRVRFEWSSIWQVLGDHFEQVGCHPNPTIAIFALDKLRQLAYKFLEIEELPTFKFQKEFLRPFEVIMRNNGDYHIKDMCLMCLQQLIQSKSSAIKSGWKSILACFIKAARDGPDSISNLSFEIVKNMIKGSFDSILRSGCFSDLVLCIAELCKNRKQPKLSLQATEVMRICISLVEEHLNQCNEEVADKLRDDVINSIWSPLLFGIHDVIMTSELEVRTRSLQYLFGILKARTPNFSREFWDLLSKTIILPTFDDLKVNPSSINLQNSKFSNKEELSIWLSTTLIQALRQTVELITCYFPQLKFLLPEILNLLNICMLHENESMARIGSTCLQQIVIDNINQLTPTDWVSIIASFDALFTETIPMFLMFEFPKNVENMVSQEDMQVQKKERRREYAPRAWYTALATPPERQLVQKQLSRCVVHLQAIQTLHDILETKVSADSPEIVCESISLDIFRQLVNLFLKSYEFSRDFNDNTSLRTYLYKNGYMKQIPNLSKQEILSAQSFISFMMKRSLQNPNEAAVDSILMRICRDIMNDFIGLDNDLKKKNAAGWKPVIATILVSLAKFPDEQFREHVKIMYKPLMDLMLHEAVVDLRAPIHSVFLRIGRVYDIFDETRS